MINPGKQFLEMHGRARPTIGLTGGRRLKVTFFVVAMILCWEGAASAQSSPAMQRGLVFVRVNCAECHSIDKISASPLTIAPPFRFLHQRYPVEDLSRALAEGIITGHPTMPQFQLDPGQVGDVIAYLKSLEH